MRQQSLRIIAFLLLAQRACIFVSAFPRGNLRKLAEEWEDRDLGTGKSKSYSAKKQCVRADTGSDGVPIPLLPTQPTSGDVPDIPWLNETNQWQAPGPNDVRSPCPFLNTVANHGLVNRSGKDIDLFYLAQVVSDTFGLSFEFNSIIASQLVGFNISREDEDGIQRVDLDDLCMPGIQEHDSSLVRQDFFLDQRNHCNVDAGLLRDVLQANPFSSKISRKEMQSFLEQRITHSRTNNPLFGLTDIAVLETSAQYMTFMLIDTDADGLTTFESMDKDRFLEMMLFERLPQEFIRPDLVQKNFTGFSPLIPINTTGYPYSALPVRPFMPATDDESDSDISAPILTEFLGSSANALGRTVDTSPDEGGPCSTTSECCPGFVCANGNSKGSDKSSRRRSSASKSKTAA